MPAPDTTPAELSELLHDAEIEAERFVSLARIAVAFGLLVFFLIAVPPVEDVAHNVLIRQGELAIATILAYLIVGLLIWVAIRLRRFRRWMIWPAAITDALFVVVSVASSLDNTRLTGDEIFVFPSIWMVPLVLAFGALRGNPRTLMLTTVLIVLGLAALVGIEAGSNKGQTNSTVWLFLALPPNVMRLIMITLAGVILIIAARRTRVLVRQSIDATLRNANLTRYLPAELAPQLAAGHLDELRQGQREDIAVLFIDIRGFTRLSEAMSPSEVSGFVTEFRRRVAAAVEAHHGVIDKFMGDAAMVLFMNTEQSDQAAANSLACARAMQTGIAQWSDGRVASGHSPVTVGIGVHYGTVFSGVVGDETRLEYTVFGDTVNVAARLQEMSKDLASPVLATRQAVSAAGVGNWSRIAQTPLRGRQADMEILAPDPA